MPATLGLPPALGENYQQVYATSFPGTTLPPGWAAAQGLRGSATDTPQAISVNNGLTITTATVNGVNLTGFLTLNTLPTKYGYFQARMEALGSPGEWSAFWLYNAKVDRILGDINAAGSEVDIAELLAQNNNGTNLKNSVQSNVHINGYGAEEQSVGSGLINSATSPFDGNFHVYGVAWTPTSLDFYVDGVHTYSTTFGVSGQPLIVQLSSEVQQGGWAGNEPAIGYGSFSTSTTKLIVSDVQIYQRTVLADDVPDTEMLANGSITVPIHTYNPGNLTYTLSETSSNNTLLPAGSFTFTNGNLQITPAAQQTGIANITVTARSSDGSEAGYATFTIRVNAGNTPLNGMFENGLSPWSATGAATLVNYNQRTGNDAVRLDGMNSGISRIVTGLMPNTTYQLTASAFSQQGGPIYIGATGFGGTAVQMAIANTRYLTDSITFTTGPTSTTATIYVTQGAGSTEGYVDDISLAQQTPVLPPLPSAPTGMTASAGAYSTMVVITWNSVPGATSYDLLRSQSNNPGTATLLVGNLTTTTYNDTTATPGVTYFYFAQARNAAGISALSSPASGFTGAVNSPPVTASPFTSTVWVKSTWGSGPGSGFDAQVHVTNSSNTAYASMQMSFDLPCTIIYIWGGTILSSANNHYVISLASGLSANGSADFGFVAGPVLAGPLQLLNQSFLGIPAQQTPVLPALPAAPTGMTASDGAYSNMVVIAWNSVPGATSYDVLRSQSNNPGTATLLAGNLAATTYNDTTATPGVTYFYFAQARNAAGISALSNPDSGSVAVATLVITTSNLASWTANVGYSQTIVASGGIGTHTFGVTGGSPPPGLTVNNTTGAIAGTPTTAGTFNFTVTVTDSVGSVARRSFSVLIDPPLVVTTATLANGMANTSYSQTIAVTGGTGLETFAVTGGSLPNGLTMNSTTGAVAGTPATAGSFNFTVSVTDSIGALASRNLSVTVNSPPVAASPFTSTVWVKSTWGSGPGSGFDAQVHVTNSSNTAYASMQMGFDLPCTITYIWGGTILNSANNHYVISLASGLSANGSADFGFVAGPVLAGPLQLLNQSFMGIPVAPVLPPPPVNINPLTATSWAKSTWTGGADIQVHIDNTSGSAYSGASIEFDIAGDITSIWGGVIASHNGNHYVISLGGGILAKSSADFGFVVRSSLPGALQTANTKVTGAL